MKFGYFDDANREYVITTPKTPLPWINYLGCKEFFTLISNTCGGYTFYKDAKLLRLTRYRYNDVPYDTNGKYFYIKDGDTIWNPGWQPTKTELDSYECRHGIGYSRFTASKNDVQASVLTFVPMNDNCEISQVKIKNNSGVQKNISLFSYVEWCLWNADDDSRNFQRNLSTGEVEVIGSTIYHKTEYRERRNHYAVYTVNTEVDGFDTIRDSFIGTYNGADKPEAVLAGKCTNSMASGWSPIAAHQISITLAPGEEKSYVFLLGYLENPVEEKFEAPNVVNKKPANAMIAKYNSDAAVDKAFAELNDYWKDLLGRYVVESSNEKVNRMVNIWNQYQCMVTFNMSRSASYYESGIGRGMGFRDSCQDLLGFVHLIPDRARERIIDIASTQFQDGSAYHQYQPLTKKGNSDIGSGFNDDPLWLIAGTSAYVRETGDLSILKEMVPYDNDMSVATTLMEHLKRSFDYIVNHKGPHKLPLIGRADWNDCLNLNCFSEEPGESFQTTGPSEGPVAESVFIAGMFVLYGRQYAALCRGKGLHEEAEQVEEAVRTMERTVKGPGWDGAWFVRAYDAKSHPVGSKSCAEGQIYIEPQGMCVMAGIGLDDGKAVRALDSVRERLLGRYGVELLSPCYTVYHKELGEISSYPPGYKENGSIFCHNNPWISIAETVAGRGDNAFDVYRRTCPIYQEEHSEVRKVEPYVYAQTVAARASCDEGAARNSWLTGAAAWTFVNISQYILGVKPTPEGLRIDPCLPEELGEYTVRRRYRGSLYRIHVRRTGTWSLTVDGTPVNGKLIPNTGKTEYRVEVTV